MLNPIFREMKNNLSALLMIRWARMDAEGTGGTEHKGGAGGGPVYIPGVVIGKVSDSIAISTSELDNDVSSFNSAKVGQWKRRVSSVVRKWSGTTNGVGGVNP